jgi:NTE family protein
MQHGGLIEGEKVFSVIRKMVGDMKIESLPIHFTAVATDIIKQKEVWFQKGDLLDAIRASIAIPSVFTPVRKSGMVLVDGGVLNPLPIAPTLSDISDQTIAVNLNGEKREGMEISVPKREQEKAQTLSDIFFEMAQKAPTVFFQSEKKKVEEMSMLEVMGHTIDVMQNAVFKCKMAGYAPDIMIDIPYDICDFYEFHRAYEMIETGKILARQQLQTKE